MDRLTADAVVDTLAEYYWRSRSLHHERMDLAEVRAADAAFDAVEALLHIPRVGVWLLLRLIETASTADQRAYLAAGPLEELLEIVDVKELAALDGVIRENSRLVDCLHRVNMPDSPIARSWLEEKLSTYPPS